MYFQGISQRFHGAMGHDLYLQRNFVIIGNTCECSDSDSVAIHKTLSNQVLNTGTEKVSVLWL